MSRYSGHMKRPSPASRLHRIYPFVRRISFLVIMKILPASTTPECVTSAEEIRRAKKRERIVCPDLSASTQEIQISSDKNGQIFVTFSQMNYQ